MIKRLISHVLLWISILIMYVSISMLLAGPSDLAYSPLWRFIRFIIMEMMLMPWRVLPFYFAFYWLLPRFFSKQQFLWMFIFFTLFLIPDIIAYRLTIAPMAQWMYNESLDVNIFSLRRLSYTLIDVTAALALAATFKLLKGKIEQEQKSQALEKEKLRAELSFLKAQTQPHFLFNTLNNIYGLARKQDEKTAPSVLKLAHMMRYILYECSSETVRLEDEIKVIEDYIELEKLRYDDHLKLDFKAQIDDRQQAIAPLILLPFVENAFKHGASESRFNPRIEIDIQLEQKILSFRVENDRDALPVSRKPGIGLSNVKRQLSLIYGAASQLEILAQEDSFIINLTIDFNAYAQSQSLKLSHH